MEQEVVRELSAIQRDVAKMMAILEERAKVLDTNSRHIEDLDR